ncbi:hypothetical protein A2V54_01125 [candidate division WWE3 bacterium RBG_19FT_COMBO_53_11]|uniref:Uncharacterized protein n=1 Tax=candidate division WWE3 bacterium RBG_19FT_COMBO_53_11 TaxID=1802613 RepID=A0A1F4UHT4_UNCKA|nr:MAG: hypothetical protein A2V54_01125 [candidate division WWE3 bacterium RBG_19FT_COMBO_53_11]
MPTGKSFLNRPEVRTWGIPLGLFLIGILLVVLGVVPIWEEVKDLRITISSEKDRITALQEKSRKLSDLADQVEGIDKNFEVFDQAVTSESKVPELLTQIQKISDSCRVKVTAMQFGGETQKSGENSFEVRVQYASESSLSQLKCLVSSLEGASRLVDFESLRYNLGIDTETKAESVLAQSTLISYYTPEPKLLPDNPITFSLSDPQFLGNVELLKDFKVY